MFEDRIDLSETKNAIDAIKAEVSKIIVGQDAMVNQLIIALLANGHVLIEGFPGLGKTLTAKILAKCISTDFSRIQFTPDLMPSDVIGTSVFNFKDSSFEFKKGPIFSNIVLIDEINRAPAKTQAALFESMEERQVTSDGKQYVLSSPFIVLATQNPIDMEGTYRLPEAQMDRFLFKIKVDYPSQEEEQKILQSYHEMKNNHDISNVKAIVTADDIIRHQEVVRKIHIDENLINYITTIVQNTRKFKDISLGASPRASLSILASSKALALMSGRDFVTPDDVLNVTKPVLRHRITISPEREMEGVSVDAIINALVKRIEVPR